MASNKRSLFKDRTIATLCIVLLTCPLLLGQQVKLLANLNTSESPRKSSNPANFTELNGQIIFNAYTLEHGYELWSSDGTNSGTKLIKDINEGGGHAQCQYLTRLGNLIYFSANDGEHGWELWRTDGTPSGTYMVLDIEPRPGFSSSPADLTILNNTLYFTAKVSGQRNIWSTDGTSKGTKKVFGLDQIDTRQLVPLNDQLFFVSEPDKPGVSRHQEFWVTDGTIAGTKQLMDIPKPINTDPPELVAGDSFVYFIASDSTYDYQVFRTDGSLNGTEPLTSLDSTKDHPPKSITYFNDSTILFEAWSKDEGYEPWISRNEVGTEHMIADVNPGNSSSNAAPFYQINNTFLFFPEHYKIGTEPWISDGTEKGTVVLRDIGFKSISSIYRKHTVAYSNRLFFIASSPDHDYQLWSTDGTGQGTQIHNVANANPNTTSINNMYVLDSTLFLGIYDPINGSELWKYSHYEDKFSIIKNIYQGEGGIEPQELTAAGGSLYFTATVEDHHRELWTFNGSSVRQLSGLDSGTSTGSTARQLTEFKNKLYYVTGSGMLDVRYHESHLDTPASVYSDKTWMTKNRTGQLLKLNNLLNILSRLSGEWSLWESDGTERGTSLVAKTPYLDNLTQLTTTEKYAYFVGNDRTHGSELWIIDRDKKLAHILLDIEPGMKSSNPRELVVVDQNLFFVCNLNNEVHLFSTNGSELGTRPITENVFWPPFEHISVLTKTDKFLFFEGQNRVHGSEPWVYDINENYTKLLKDIAPGNKSSNPANFTQLDDQYVFTATDSAHGEELWVSDGTEEGTHILKDIESGISGSRPSRLYQVGNQVYFVARTKEHGQELWVTDGTSQGTTLVEDIIPGVIGSSPYYLTKYDNKLVFVAKHPIYDKELFYIDLPIDTTTDTLDVLVNIYPNPASGHVQFLDVDQVIKPNTLITIYDLLGKEVTKFNYQPDEKIDIKYLHSGTYIVRVASGLTFKLIKI